jgi:hypothetical protein
MLVGAPCCVQDLLVAREEEEERTMRMRLLTLEHEKQVCVGGGMGDGGRGGWGQGGWGQGGGGGGLGRPALCLTTVRGQVAPLAQSALAGCPQPLPTGPGLRACRCRLCV